MSAPRRLAGALAAAREADAQQHFTQGVVTAFTSTTVTITVGGSSSTWPKLSSYSPTVGDVVWLGGPPGEWVCLGTIAPTAAGSGGGAPAAHSHAQVDVTNLAQDLAGKANINHGHGQADVSGLADALAGKAALNHGHGLGDISGLQSALDGKVGTSDGRLTDARAWSLYGSGTPVAGNVPTFDETSGTYRPAAPPSASGTNDSVARTALFGASGNTEAPVAEYQLTTGFTNLASADYFLASQFSAVVDNFNMLNTAFGFYRIVVPYAGRWDVEYVWHGNVLPMAAKVARNVPNGTSPGTATGSYGVMTGSQGTGGEAVVRIAQSIVLAANDSLSFLLWAGGTFSMPVTTWGAARTRFMVRWKGPK